ncbi:MAG: hypothetical protein U1E55_05440 [Paracoccus sp. (in: a-proteobacteria)]
MTTRVPLALLPVVAERILFWNAPPCRPRRRAHGRNLEREPVGQTVGYRIRGEAVAGARRIEVVTEGILTRMIQSDPGWTGSAA